MSRGIRAYTNTAVHQSPDGRAGSESDEQSLLSLPSSLESIHPTDITKQSITSTIRPTFFQNLSSSVLTKQIYSIRPENTTHTCHIGTIPVILTNGECTTCISPTSLSPYMDFFAVMPTLQIFLIDLPKSDILYLPIYRNIFISTGL